MTEEKKEPVDLPNETPEASSSPMETGPEPEPTVTILPEEESVTKGGSVEPDFLDKIELQPAQPASSAQAGSSDYTFWERLNPVARRKKQMNNMHEGYQEILSLVRTMRDNLDHQIVAQKQLVTYMQALPEAVEGMRSLSQSAGEHTEMLKIMQGQLDSSLEHNRSMGGSVDRFNSTLVSMDQTTKQLVSQSRESEQELRRMLGRAQRRMAFLTFVLLLMLISAVGGFAYLTYRTEIHAFFENRASQSAPAPAAAPELVVVPEIHDTAVVDEDLRMAVQLSSNGIELVMASSTAEVEIVSGIELPADEEIDSEELTNTLESIELPESAAEEPKAESAERRDAILKARE